MPDITPDQITELYEFLQGYIPEDLEADLLPDDDAYIMAMHPTEAYGILRYMMLRGLIPTLLQCPRCRTLVAPGMPDTICPVCLTEVSDENL